MLRGARGLAVSLIAPLAIAMIQCGVDAEGGPAVADGGVDGGPDATTEDAPASPFGIDSRPANPTCKAPKRPPPANALDVKLERHYPNVPLSAPVVMTKAKGMPRWYVAQLHGKVVSFPDNETATEATTVLDLTAKVDILSLESGLLGFALHPRFTQNGFAYVYYGHDSTTPQSGTRLSRFTSTDGGLTFSPASEKVLLEVPRDITRHLGGNVVFGPDGYLYVGLGDGADGPSSQLTNGPCDQASGCAVFAGKMLRLDVDAGDPYAIPPSNPFAKGGGRPEIWAWGFRNPWRWSFDRGSGDLWLADVGETAWEEIDIVRAGGNYGWMLAEGAHCLVPGTCGPDLVDPIFEVAHPESLAITGGYVYRGAKTPRLEGAYLFGDFVNGALWALVTDPATGARSKVTLNAGGPPVYVASFAETDDGEVLAVDLDTAPDGKAKIWSFVPSTPTADTFPKKLSATGCVSPSDATQPATGVIPYGLNVPFWSDGAEKDRWLAIPDGTTIGIGADGDFDLPIGAVTMKTFRAFGARAETRLFVRHDDGDWAGYAYAWDADGKDATLVPDARVVTVAGKSWAIPSRADCMRCHTAAAGRTLGLELAQLERAFDYPGRPARDQLATLEHIGLFATKPTRGAPLPRSDSNDPLEARTRAYLHVNCAGCHRPGVTTSGAMDLRFSTAFGKTGICDVDPQRGTMGIKGAKLFAPGAPDKSLLLLRPRSLDVWRMPPVASRVVDGPGTALLESWIGARKTCE